jgi:hypothetical protein
MSFVSSNARFKMQIHRQDSFIRKAFEEYLVKYISRFFLLTHPDIQYKTPNHIVLLVCLKKQGAGPFGRISV